MTFSIVGRNPDGSALGVAVASKFLAVGSAVPAAGLDAGAIATQSFANTLYRRDGLAHLRAGRDAQATVDALLGEDVLREERQVGVVDAAGRSASWTGSGCLPWAGDDLAYDLRVDDHPDPVGELSRLLGLHHAYFDSPRDEDLIPLEGALVDEVERLLHRVGYDSLEEWAGVENYELRLRPGSVDPFVLERLRHAAGA